jgi:hypothetical protein
MSKALPLQAVKSGERHSGGSRCGRFVLLAKVTLGGEFPVVKADDVFSSCEVHPAVSTDSSKRYNFFIDDNIFSSATS